MFERNKSLNFRYNPPSNSFWKYDLSHESLAAAASGMTSFADLDKRCITFTIHLDDPARHEPLCRTLFGTIEVYLTKFLGRNPRVSHSGLFSALDVNGSKFSGWDRDPRQNHCHGCIFIPHGITAPQVDRLLGSLRDAALMADGVKSGPDAIRFNLFNRNSHAATLADYLAYSLKEAVRIDAGGTFAVILPFDSLILDGGDVEKMVRRRQEEILRTLGGPDRFKVYREAQKDCARKRQRAASTQKE